MELISRKTCQMEHMLFNKSKKLLIGIRFVIADTNKVQQKLTSTLQKGKQPSLSSKYQRGCFWLWLSHVLDLLCT